MYAADFQTRFSRKLNRKSKNFILYFIFYYFLLLFYKELRHARFYMLFSQVLYIELHQSITENLHVSRSAAIRQLA